MRSIINALTPHHGATNATTLVRCVCYETVLERPVARKDVYAYVAFHGPLEPFWIQHLDLCIWWKDRCCHQRRQDEEEGGQCV